MDQISGKLENILGEDWNLLLDFSSSFQIKYEIEEVCGSAKDFLAQCQVANRLPALSKSSGKRPSVGTQESCRRRRKILRGHGQEMK